MDGIIIHEKNFIGIKQVCYWIGLTRSQGDRQIKNIKVDPLLQRGIRISTINTNGGPQTSLLLELKYLPVWIATINRKCLNEEQFTKLISLYNWVTSEEFEEMKVEGSIYTSEKLLEDDLYSEGGLGNIRFTGRQIRYEFGRTDIEGIDDTGKKVILELKKYKEDSLLIEQCIHYAKSFKEKGIDVRMVIVAYDCSGIKEECEKLGFECYEYKRKLTLNKVN